MESGKTFPELFEQFLVFCEQILKYHVSGDLILNPKEKHPNKLQVGLKRYQRIFAETRDSKKHIDKFKEVYLKCRPMLIEMTLDQFMLRFQKESLILSIEEGSQTKIYLTVFFNKCCKIAKHVDEESRKSLTPDLYLEDPASAYPEMFMLHLYRLFTFCASEEDVRKYLQPKIEELEETLDVKKDEVPTFSTGMNEFYGAFQNLADKVGLKIPQNGKLTDHQFMQTMNQAMNDPKMIDSLRGMFGGMDLNDPKTVYESIMKALGEMQKNAQMMPEGVQKSLDAGNDGELALVPRTQ